MSCRPPITNRRRVLLFVITFILAGLFMTFRDGCGGFRGHSALSLVEAVERAWKANPAKGGFDAGGVNYSSYPEYGELVNQGSEIVFDLVEILHRDPCREVAALAILDILSIPIHGLPLDPCKLGPAVIGKSGLAVSGLKKGR